MTHPTVQRIENAFGSETARRFEKVTSNRFPAYMHELGKNPSVKVIIAGAFRWRTSEEGLSYWCNLAGPKFPK